jgi:hypothetical protein
MAISAWRKSLPYVLGNSVALYLSGIKAAIDAEVAANPTTALWQVSDFNATNGTLVLKPTANAASGVGNRRFILFGGVGTPSVASVGGITFATAGTLCGGFAPTAGVDAPQQSYVTGVPFTTGEYLGGGIILTPSAGLNRVTYFELDQGIIICIHRDIQNVNNGNIATCIAGQLGVSMDGSTLYDVCSASGNAWVANPDSGLTGQISLATNMFPCTSSPNGIYAQFKFLSPIDGVVNVIPNFTGATDAQYSATDFFEGARKGQLNERYFFSIPMRHLSFAYTEMKMRQIAWGINGIFGEAISDISGVQALKLGCRSDIADQGPWLTNFQA